MRQKIGQNKSEKEGGKTKNQIKKRRKDNKTLSKKRKRAEKT
jgi:hypothetical protein